MRFAPLGLLIVGCGGAIDSSVDAGPSDASQEPARKHSCHDDVGSNVAAAPTFTRVIANGEGIALAIDRCGNVYVTGGFHDTLDTGTGPHTANGKSDVFLVKLDATGKTLWTKTFGGAGDDEAEHIAIDDEDNVVIAGQSNGGIDFGGGPMDVGASNLVGFLARVDGSGTTIASKGLVGYGTIMSVFEDETYTVRYIDSGTILARHSRTLDEVWTVPIKTEQGGGGPTTLLAMQNAVRVGGTLHGSLSIGDDTFQAPANTSYIAMIASSGAPLWVKPFGCPVTPLSQSSGTTRIWKLGFAHNGGFLSTGEFSGAPCDIGGGSWTGEYDPYVVRHSASGSTTWAIRFPSTRLWDVGRAVAEAPNGNVVVTGGFNEVVDFGDQKLTSAGSLDIFLAQLDPKGKTIWSKRFGGSDLDIGYDVKVDETGAIFATGWFVDNADFGDGPVSVPGVGLYVLKLQP